MKRPIPCKRLTRISLALVGVLTACTADLTHAHADILYDKLAHNDDIAGVFGVDNLVFGRADVAAMFSTGAHAYNNLVFTGAFTYYTNTNGLIFELHADSAGLPGSVLATSASFDAAPEPGSLLSWVLDPSISINAGTNYWFSARASNADGYLGWNLNNTGAMGFAHSSDGTSWNAVEERAPAFRVTGSMMSAPGAVPEPGAWATMAVMGASTLGLILRRRRRNQA